MAVLDPGRQNGQARWLKGDLHLHSNHSDGRWTVQDIVGYVRQNNLDFICLTDHNTITARADLHDAIRRAGLSTVLIPGMELTTFWGHANALGVENWIDWRVRGPGGAPSTIGTGPTAPMTGTMSGAAAATVAAGGLLVINHPRAEGYPVCTGCRWELGDESATYAAAVEVMNGAWPRTQNVEAMELWDRWLNAGRRLPAVAGTDSHGEAKRPDLLGFTFALAQPDPISILEAVGAGRTFLSRGPILRWRNPAPGNPLEEGAGTVHLDVDALPGPVDVALIADGTRIDVVRIEEAQAISFELDKIDHTPRWIRVELYAARGGDLLALTNPAFASRSA